MFRQKESNAGKLLKMEREGSEEENLNSEIKSSNTLALGNAQVHQSKKGHREIIDDPQLRSCIALKDRMAHSFYNFMCCKDQQGTFVNELELLERTHPISLSDQVADTLLRDQIVELQIIETSRLELDPNIIHPFVKVHFVDKNTGTYLKKTSPNTCVYHTELNSYYDQDKKKYQSCENDLILPFATISSDFRVDGNSRGMWHQKFYINQQAIRILTKDTIILFQILDFNHQLLASKSTSDLDRNGFYRVAWAFLRPIGLSKKHIGFSKLQLYRYKLDSKKLPEEYAKSFIPAVYYDFIWPGHEKYQGCLSVRLNPIDSPKYTFTQQLQAPEHLFQLQKPDKNYLKRYSLNPAVTKNQQVKQDRLLKYYRLKECLVPEKLIAKFKSAQEGCLRIAMSDYQIFCCCTEGNRTVIKVYSLETFAHVMTLKGHANIIYWIGLSHDQKYLMSVGSDMTAKLWLIPQLTGQHIDQQQSQSYLVADCVHPSFVYCGSILQGSLQNSQFLVTGCYDGLIRLWKVDSDRYVDCEVIKLESSEEHVYPTSIACAEGFFVVGDSMGTIHVYDVELGLKTGDKHRRRLRLTHPQLKEDLVRCIRIYSKSEILVQSKDNMIRHISFSSGQIKIIKSFVGAQSQSYPISFTISPDKRFILSGSDQGSPVMWDFKSGQLIPTQHLQLSIMGPITDCFWSKRFNLVAFCGFVEECPIFLYGNVGKESETQAVLAVMQQQLQQQQPLK